MHNAADWSRRVRSWKKRGYDVYVYFDNDQNAAPADALKLTQLLKREPAAATRVR